MDPIKDAFSHIKQDIEDIRSNILWLSNEIEGLKRTLFHLTQQIDTQNKTIQQINKTALQFPTDNLPLYALKSSNTNTSTGNEGVPTNKQTNRQTDNPTQNPPKIDFLPPFDLQKEEKIDHIERVSQVLSSLDSLKKDLRSKFKRLTNQEMLVFSTIYQLEEEGFVVDYPSISTRLHLSESSIRDYSQRIIKKGIPLVKIKQNNKKITLSILPEFKKIASINTILALREL
ncbi:MAG: hypothetical protein Q8L29_01720 [archaeon]|nr:hypothetical protein [archaeon]